MKILYTSYPALTLNKMLILLFV